MSVQNNYSIDTTVILTIPQLGMATKSIATI